MKTGKRSISLILSAVMTGSLFTGCSNIQDSFEQYSQYKATNETISSDSKWINSDVIGTITEDTSVSEKDDFAAASNKEWILSVADQAKKEGSASVLDENEEIIAQQKQALLHTASEGGTFEENKVGMDPSDYKHMTETFTSVVSAAADWETRDTAGVTPLRSYISAIDSIGSLEQMNRYLCNENEDFLSGDYLIPFQIANSLDKEDPRYYVILTSPSIDSQKEENENSSLYSYYVMDTVTGILTKLGYSSKDAERVVKQCWQLETALSEHTAYTEIIEHLSSEDDIRDQFNNIYTQNDLMNLSGNYPLLDILKTYHYDTSDEYVVYEPDYVQSVARLYTEKNLEKIKSYYIVHTILSALPLLDKKDYWQYESYFGNASSQKKSEDAEQTDENGSADGEEPSGSSTKEETLRSQLSEDEQILLDFTTTYINELFEEMYVTSYCSADQKTYVQTLIQEAIAEYKKILSGEDWMSDATRQKAIEKLDHLTTRVLYPDVLNGCNDLQITSGSLLDIVSKIKAYNLRKEAPLLLKTTDKTAWDLNYMPTTTVNAYYSASDNSITILSGIIASGALFDLNASDEENMAHLGYIIGHEISHAFDTNGYLYDKDGNESKWWTDADEEAFQKRVAKLANYYSSFKCFRSLSSNINGEQIQGEAIADTGGLKCMLEISKQREGFDYPAFFRAFAHTWATCRKSSVELQAFYQDSHPLPFLRTNVTVQQFEEFYDAFDIHPGDGMYLAPEKRILVW